MAKKHTSKKPPEDYYKGVTYIVIQSSKVPKETYEHLEKFVMGLHNCKMLVYTSIQSGKPGNCQNGICH